MPIGLQIIGPALGEELLLDTAYAFESLVDKEIKNKKIPELVT